MTTFSDRYRAQLDAVWASLVRVGEAHERAAPVLARDANPSVVRIAQVTAFATALARARSWSEMSFLLFPTLARTLPHLTHARPPATIAAMTMDNATVRVETPGTVLQLPRTNAPAVQFVTAWAMAHVPIRVTEARIIRPSPSKQALALTLEARAGVSFSTVLGKWMRFFVDSSAAFDLIHALRGTTGHARAFGADGRLLGEREVPSAVQWVRIDTDEASLTPTATRSTSSDLFGDLVNFPESFAFFDLFTEPLRLDPKVRRIELLLPLAKATPAVDAITVDAFRLGAAPAVNVIEATVSRVLVGREHMLSLEIAADPASEVLAVRRVRCSDRATATEVPLYEASAPGTIVHGGVFAKLRRMPAVVGDRTSVELEFVDPRTGSCPPPKPQVDVDVMATQRYACEDLGAGDLRGLSAVNVTRVMRGRPVRWGEELAWRHHAYARMPASDLGRSASTLEAFFGLWDGDRVESAPSASVTSHRVLSAQCDRAHALEDGAIRHGLLFDLNVDAASFSSAGEAWLWGELLSRALAEHESSLRFTQLAWTAGELVNARFGLRHGCVSPGLFG